MSKTTVIVIAAIALMLVLIATGGDRVAGIVVGVVIAGGAGFVALVIAAIPIAIIGAILDRRKLAAAIREYHDIQLKYGYSAQDHCPHRVFTVGHTNYVVFTGSDKWCKVCGKHLGAAKRKKSWFWGARWE